MKNWHQKAQEQLSCSDKLAIGINNTVGSMKFIAISTVIIIAWITANVVWSLWDKFPFILLNLMFSAFAFYASPLILMAGNIAAARGRLGGMEPSGGLREVQLLGHGNKRSQGTQVHILTHPPILCRQGITGSLGRRRVRRVAMAVITPFLTTHLTVSGKAAS